jgi:hypothetical protein
MTAPYDDRVERGDEGHGDQRAGDPGEVDAGGDRQQHSQRVHAHHPAEEERLEHLRLDLLHPDHAAEHDEPRDRPLVDQRDEAGDEAGDRRADQRHEGAEEDQDADGHDERHVEDRGDDHDAEGVDERHEHGRPDELGERHPGDAARGVGPLACRPREDPDHPRPDLPPVAEEEERREQDDEEGGDELGDRRADVLEPADQLGVAGRHQRLDLVDRVVDLRVTDVEWSVLQPPPDLLETVDHLAGEVGGALDDLLGGEGEHERHPTDDRDDDHERGEAPSEDRGQQVDHRGDQGGDEQRDDDRHDHQR